MATKYNKLNKLIYIAVIVILLYILYYSQETYEHVDISIKNRTLENDGFVVLHNNVYNQTENEACFDLKKDILSLLPKGYEFIDYVYKINNVALSTFHRDVTSSHKIYKTEHKVYTLILYKYDGDFLSVCPGSDKTYPFVWSRPVTIHGVSGTAFLFDCELLHAGCINLCKERHVIQYKLCHRDDLSKLIHLNGIRHTKNDVCKMGIYYDIMRKLSFFFEMPINYLLYPIMTKKEPSDSVIGFIQSFIPIQYYNNY